jgi:hypothetical protein
MGDEENCEMSSFKICNLHQMLLGLMHWVRIHNKKKFIPTINKIN